MLENDPFEWMYDRDDCGEAAGQCAGRSTPQKSEDIRDGQLSTPYDVHLQTGFAKYLCTIQMWK